jgi:hypothetical protein
LPAAKINVSLADVIAWQCAHVARHHAELQHEASRDDWHGQIVKRVQPLEEA